RPPPVREAELPDLHSQAELGNEERGKRRPALRLSPADAKVITWTANSAVPREEEPQMLTIHDRGARLCDGLTRRDVLHAGGLGLLGLSLPELFRNRAAAAGKEAAGEAPRRVRAKSCIVLFLMGGPDQHSTWDPKPDAPAEVRGPFKPIATSVPG